MTDRIKKLTVECEKSRLKELLSLLKSLGVPSSQIKVRGKVVRIPKSYEFPLHGLNIAKEEEY